MATSAKFQLNISKMTPDRPEKHRDLECEYYYSIQCQVRHKNIVYDKEPRRNDIEFLVLSKRQRQNQYSIKQCCV